MCAYNWKQFTKRITIHAAPQEIFHAWATRDGLEKWFLRVAEFRSSSGLTRAGQEVIRPGDHYRWLWFGYDDSTVEEGEILSSDGREELQFTFTAGCIVKVVIKQEAAETVCELQQTMPMESETDQQYFFIECGKGWIFYLANLKSILEGGVDLRNKNEQIQNVVNA